MRGPTRAVFGERAWRRHAFEAIGQAEAIADTKVVDWQDVGPPELENQQHFDGPAADAAHLHNAFDNSVIVKRVQFCRRGHNAGNDFFRQVAQRTNLGEGKTNCAQRGIRSYGQRLGFRKFRRRIERNEAAENALRGRAVELLVSDRTRERSVKTVR